MDDEVQEQKRIEVLQAVFKWFAEADFLTPEAFQVLQRLSLDFENIEENREFLENIRLITQLKKHQDAACQDDYAPWPKEGDLLGEVPLGFVLQNSARICLTLDDLQHHVFIAGQTGTGKTTLFHILLLSLIQIHKVPVLIFDQQKDFRHLLSLNGRNLGVREVQVFRPQDFRFNPLQPPPGVSLETWRDLFCRVFCQSYYLLAGSLGFLRRQVQDLYAAYGVTSGQSTYPSLFDLLEQVENFKLKRQYGREAGFFESTRQRLDECGIAFAETFDCSHGFPVEDLLEKTVIFEVGDLDDASQRFFTTLLLTAIFQYRKSAYEMGPLRHVIFFDEAKRIYHAARENTREFGPSVISELTSQVRKLGEGLVVGDHFPSEIGKSIRGSAGTQLCFRLTDSDDVMTMARSMQLTPAQQADLIQLQPGQALLRTLRYPQPVVVQLLPIQDLATINVPSDGEIAERMSLILEDMRRAMKPRQRYVAKPEAKEPSRNGKQEHTKPKGPAPSEVSASQKAASSSERNSASQPALGPEALKFLLDILDHPFDGVAARYKRLELAPARGNRLKNFLRRSGLLEELKVDVGGQGGIRNLLALTDQALAQLGSPKRPYPGKGGLLHCFWQHLLAKAFQNEGYSTEIEATLNGHGIDILATQNGERLAVEIGITSAEQEIINLARDQDLGMDRIILACTDKLLPEIQRRLESLDCQGPPPVHLLTLRQLYQDLRRKRGLTLTGL